MSSIVVAHVRIRKHLRSFRSGLTDGTSYPSIENIELLRHSFTFVCVYLFLATIQRLYSWVHLKSLLEEIGVPLLFVAKIFYWDMQYLVNVTLLFLSPIFFDEFEPFSVVKFVPLTMPCFEQLDYSWSRITFFCKGQLA